MRFLKRWAGRGTDWHGTALTLSAAAAFGMIPVFAKLAYRHGITVTQLQVARFAAVTTVTMAIAVLAPVRCPASTPPPRWGLIVLGGFGMAVYGPQSFLFFTALSALPATVVELVFYIYPALVVIGARLAYGRPISGRRSLAVGLCTVGAALVVGLGGFKVTFALGLALVTPLVYAGYLLAAERLLLGIDAVTGTAAITAGASLFWIALIVLRGETTAPHWT